jgi:uncharacterized membrane protein HdeD (DUF308 family)
MRGLEVVAGVISIILAIYVLAYPTVAVLTLLVFLSVGLLLLGIRQIMIGAGARWRPGWLRVVGIVMGIVAIILGFLVIAYPGYGVATLVLLLAFGLLLIGVAEIAIGSGSRFARRWLRALLIVIGVLDLVLAPIVLLAPGLAVATLIFLLSLFLLLNGIDLIASGAVGRIQVTRAAVATAAGKGPA